MMHKFHITIALLLLLLFISHSFARKLAPKEEGIDVHSNHISSKEYVAEMEKNDSFDKLMGVEECDTEDDEECLKRRIIAEAHLDYIYTQEHKP